MITQLVDKRGRLWNPPTIVRSHLKPRSPIANGLVVNDHNQVVNIKSGSVIISSHALDMIGIDTHTYVLLHNGNVILIQNSIQHLIARNIKLMIMDKNCQHVVLINSQGKYLSIVPSRHIRSHLPHWQDIIMHTNGIFVTTSHVHTIDVVADELETYATPIGMIDITQWNNTLLGLTRHKLIDIITGKTVEVLVDSPITGFLRSYEVNDNSTYFYCEDGSVHLLLNNGKTSKCKINKIIFK